MKAADTALSSQPCEHRVAEATADTEREGKGGGAGKRPDVSEEITFLALHPSGSLKEVPPSCPGMRALI